MNQAGIDRGGSGGHTVSKVSCKMIYKGVRWVMCIMLWSIKARFVGNYVAFCSCLVAMEAEIINFGALNLHWGLVGIFSRSVLLWPTMKTFHGPIFAFWDWRYTPWGLDLGTKTRPPIVQRHLWERYEASIDVDKFQSSKWLGSWSTVDGSDK